MCFWFPGALGPVIGKHVAGLMSGASNGWGELGLILSIDRPGILSKASNATLSWFTERATMDDRSLDLPWTCHGPAMAWFLYWWMFTWDTILPPKNRWLDG
jgi:hypothetical protein